MCSGANGDFAPPPQSTTMEFRHSMVFKMERFAVSSLKKRFARGPLKTGANSKDKKSRRLGWQGNDQ
eukprot:166867-Pelagomonas_calceolata.AAC.2